MTHAQLDAAIAALPPEAYLGQAVTFTISDQDVDLTALKSMLVQRSLKTSTVKSRIRRIDAFKRASNDIATRFPRHPLHQDSLLVKPVGQDSQESHRLVVFERRTRRTQASKPRVETNTIWRIMYDRGERQADGTWRDDFVNVEQQAKIDLNPVQRDWVNQTIGEDGEALRRNFEHHSVHIDAHGVRTSVREYLMTLSAMNLKGSNGGGLYFVPQQHLTELANLTEVVRSIGSSMNIIPMLNTAELREFVTSALIAEVHDWLQTMQAAMNKIMMDENRTIFERTKQAHLSRMSSARQSFAEYQQLLGERVLDEAAAELSEFESTLAQLDTRVYRPKSITV